MSDTQEEDLYVRLDEIYERLEALEEASPTPARRLAAIVRSEVASIRRRKRALPAPVRASLHRILDACDEIAGEPVPDAPKPATGSRDCVRCGSSLEEDWYCLHCETGGWPYSPEGWGT